MKHMPARKWHRFYGSTTIGEKGQVVIPAEAREAMHLKKGEKMLVFGMGDNMIALSTIDHMEQFTHHLESKLASMKKAIKKSQ